jgi:hypothetical protein
MLVDLLRRQPLLSLYVLAYAWTGASIPILMPVVFL